MVLVSLSFIEMEINRGEEDFMQFSLVSQIDCLIK